MKFQLIPVKTKPLKRKRIGSIYDPIIFEFMDNNLKIVKVCGTGKNPEYLRRMIANRIIKLELTDIILVTKINNEVYLEKKL